MSVSPTDFYQWAANTPMRTEIATRAVVTRFYYAAYHKCLEWERTLPALGDPRNPNGLLAGSHQQLLNRLHQPDASCSPAQQIRSRQLAAALANLRTYRTQADYHLQRTVTQLEGQAVLSYTRVLLAQAVPIP
jgi:hypothetical protein